jgi:hypothetical protein
VKSAVDNMRTRIGTIVWIIAVLCALVLAATACWWPWTPTRRTTSCSGSGERADWLDGPFHNLFKFEGKNAGEKSLLVNNGIAAVAYLVVGKVLERIIKP